MNATKICFSLNDAEGLHALLRDAERAKSKSPHLHAKELVMAKLSQSDTDPLEETNMQLVALRQELEDAREMLSGLDEHLSAVESRISTKVKQLREGLSNTLFCVLQHDTPLSTQDAQNVVQHIRSAL